MSALRKSTNVRTQAGPPWYVNASLQTLQVVAPPLASRMAEHLFLSPQHFPPTDREIAALAGARRSTLDHGNDRLAMWTWGKGPTVLLVHGWAGRGGQLASFVQPLVDRGLSVVAFDAPGHGRSTGRYSSLPAVARAVRAVADAAPSTVVGVIAHSMGGAATALALKAGLRLNRAVFVGAPIDPARYIGQFSTMFGLSHDTQVALQTRVADRYDTTWQALEIRAHLAEMETRLLVVHDEGDPEVPFTDALAYAELWPGAELMATKGLGHRRVLRDEEVIDRVTRFLS